MCLCTHGSACGDVLVCTHVYEDERFSFAVIPRELSALSFKTGFLTGLVLAI